MEDDLCSSHHNIDEIKKDDCGSLTQGNAMDSVQSGHLPRTHTADPQHQGGSSLTLPGSHHAPDRTTAWTSPLEQPDLRGRDNSQISSACRVLPSQNMMHTGPPYSYNYISKGSDVSNTCEMTVDDTTRQGLRHLEKMSFWPTEPMQAAHGSSLSSRLLDDGQCTAIPKDGVIVPIENFGGEALDPHPEAEFASGPVQYYPTFPDNGAMFTGEALGMGNESRAGAGTVTYFPTYA